MRPEIVVIHIVNPADVFADFEESARRIEIGLQVVGIPHGPIDFVPQAVIQRKAWLDLPIVLRVEPNGILGDMPMRVAKTTVGKICFAQQQFFDIARNQVGTPVWPAGVAAVIFRVIGKVTCSESRAREITRTVRVSALEVSSHSDRVIPLNP